MKSNSGPVTGRSSNSGKQSAFADPEEIIALRTLPPNTPDIAMIHCARIVPDEAYLRDQPDQKQLEKDLGCDVTVEIKKESVSISLLNNSIRITARYLPARGWRVLHLWADLARLLFGHTGKVITTDAELHQALSILNQLLNQLLDQYSQDRCIPGLLPGCMSYWSMIEIPMQIHDPKGELLRAVANAKLKNHHNSPLVVQGETVTFKGSVLKLSFYRKDIQLKERYHHEVSPNDHEVLRVEVTLKKAKLRSLFGVLAKHRLSHFSVSDLYRAFYHVLSGLQGGYRIPGKQTSTTKRRPTAKARALAVMFMDQKYTGTLDEFLDTYKHATGCSCKTAEQYARDIRSIIQNSSSYLLSSIFPPNGPIKSRQITPFRVDESGKKSPAMSYAQTNNIPIHNDISKVYQNIGYVPYDQFKYSKDTFKPYPGMHPAHLASERKRRRP